MAAIAKTKSVPNGRAMQIFEGTLDFASVGINTTAPGEQDMTVTGLKSTDMAVSFTCTDTGMALAIGNFRVKADNTLAVTLFNPDDAAADLAATLNFRLIVIPAI